MAIFGKNASLEDKIELSITWLLQLALFIGALLFFIELDWLNGVLSLLILMLTFLPSVLRRNYKVCIPLQFQVVGVAFVIAALFLGSLHGYYTLFWWWDIILHTLSGVLLGFVGFMLVYILSRERKVSLKISPFLIGIFALTFAMAMGTLWEIVEFGYDGITGDTSQDSLQDTMIDLILDTVGAIFSTVAGFFYIKYGRIFPIGHWIDKFVNINPSLFKRKR